MAENSEDHFQKYKDLEPWPMPEQIPGFFEVEYSDHYKQMMGYLMTMFDKREVSQRALDLCNEALNTLPAQYIVWYYKFFILEKLGYDPKEINDSLCSLIRRAPKIYQSWFYLQWLYERHGEKFDPFPLINDVLSDDPKNFHSWSFLVWYANTFNQHQKVYDLATKYINEDERNNSAWNIRKTMGDILGVSPETELDDAINSLRKISKNEASRNFAYAMCDKNPNLISKLTNLAEELKEKDDSNPNAYHMLLYAANYAGDQATISSICDKLIQIDPIRKNYYELLKSGNIKYQ